MQIKSNSIDYNNKGSPRDASNSTKLLFPHQAKAIPTLMEKENSTNAIKKVQSSNLTAIVSQKIKRNNNE
jgi:hypothetical protein